MSAKAIREHSLKTFNDLQKSGTNHLDIICSALMHQMQAMWEIAAQLAEVNERMDNEDKKFFGGLPSEKEKNKVQETKSRDAGTKQG